LANCNASSRFMADPDPATKKSDWGRRAKLGGKSDWERFQTVKESQTKRKFRL
jgi:hypothetical protein